MNDRRRGWNMINTLLVDLNLAKRDMTVRTQDKTKSPRHRKATQTKPWNAKTYYPTEDIKYTHIIRHETGKSCRRARAGGGETKRAPTPPYPPKKNCLQPRPFVHPVHQSSYPSRHSLYSLTTKRWGVSRSLSENPGLKLSSTLP